MNLIWILYFIPFSSSLIYVPAFNDAIAVSFDCDYVEDIRLSFGPRIPINGMQGKLILLHNNSCGCKMTRMRSESIPLLSRGGCNFLEKVLMMQKSGATAVIIGNHIENASQSNQILTKDDIVDLEIPSVLIQKFDYFALLKLLENDNADIRIKIMRNEPDNSCMNIFLLTFVWPCIILGVFYLSIYLFQTFRSFIKMQEFKNAISTIPATIFVKTDDATDDAEGCCCICLDDYNEGDQVKYLPCKHIFHQACIDEWFYYSCVCPLCKVRVVD